jgi:WD40 repeat protein
MRRTAVLVAIVLVSSSAAFAVETVFYGDSGRENLSAGEKVDIYVNQLHNLVLAPARTVLLEGVDYVWCVAVAPDGTVYAGTLPGGKIYRAARGDVARGNVAGGKSEVFFDTGESGVFSLAILPDGSLIAGTGSQGKVFKITPDGAGSLLATLDADYIFGLAIAPDGKILAATGGKSGRIYRLGGESPELVYQSPSTHLVAVALAPDGSIYAGSGDRGAIYRVTPDGKATVIFSAPQRVISAVAVAPDGSVYASTASISDEKGGDDEAVKSILGEIQARRQDAGANPAPPAPPAKRVYKVANSVYRIPPSGQVQTVLGLGGGLIMCVLPQGDHVLCGTAGNSGIFYVDPGQRRSAQMFQSKSEEVLSLAADPTGGFVAGLGMPGQVVKFGPDLARTGTFTSRILDGKTFNRWGQFQWTGETPTGTSLAWSVRSGNTPLADATWTDWQALDAASGTAVMNLPPSRFIQYRAQFATAAPDATPFVRDVTLAALAVNLSPTVSEINAGKEGPKPPAPPAPSGAPGPPGEPQPPKSPEPPALAGTVVVYWKGDDPDGDKLVFTLAWKDSAMPSFITLADDLTEAKYSWDTTTVPDGEYYLKVTGSDRPSNPPGTELTFSRQEGPFTVDNTSPVLSEPAVTKTDAGFTIDLDVADASSQIAGASYSIDGARWEPVLPIDGIFDSRSEKLSIKLDKKDATEVVVRAVDRAGNAGAVIAILQGT